MSLKKSNLLCVTYYSLKRGNEPHGFVQIQTEEQILNPGKKIYFDSEEKKNKKSFLKWKQKRKRKPVIDS